jgi:hypothetical protein
MGGCISPEKAHIDGINRPFHLPRINRSSLEDVVELIGMDCDGSRTTFHRKTKDVFLAAFDEVEGSIRPPTGARYDREAHEIAKFVPNQRLCPTLEYREQQPRSTLTRRNRLTCVVDDLDDCAILE